MTNDKLSFQILSRRIKEQIIRLGNNHNIFKVQNKNEFKFYFIGENVTCADNKFTCKNGECILAKWECDAEADCLDSSDEEKCGMMSSFVTDYD